LGIGDRHHEGRVPEASLFFVGRRQPEAVRQDELMPAPPRPLTIITGGGRGIGAATAIHLARRGHDLVVGYLGDAGSAEQVTTNARAAGVRALAVPADVADEDAVTELFDAAAELGAVNGLVNNAGLTAHIGDLATPRSQ